MVWWCGGVPPPPTSTVVLLESTPTVCPAQAGRLMWSPGPHLPTQPPNDTGGPQELRRVGVDSRVSYPRQGPRTSIH